MVGHTCFKGIWPGDSKRSPVQSLSEVNIKSTPHATREADLVKFTDLVLSTTCLFPEQSLSQKNKSHKKRDHRDRASWRVELRIALVNLCKRGE